MMNFMDVNDVSPIINSNCFVPSMTNSLYNDLPSNQDSSHYDVVQTNGQDYNDPIDNLTRAESSNHEYNGKINIFSL